MPTPTHEEIQAEIEAQRIAEEAAREAQISEAVANWEAKKRSD